MLKKTPLRLRLTILSVLLLLLCCLGLTVILNFSANRMANVIEATPITPATSVDGSPADAAPITPLTPSEASIDARQTFLNQSLLVMLAIVAGGGALTWLVTGRAMRPLRDLSVQMKNRTVHNLSENLPVPQSRDEVASLTLSFNEMTDNLEAAFSMQKRFSQSAAHELRTPLTVIKTRLDVFRKKPGRAPEEYEALLDSMDTQVNRLSGLVGDLLELTELDTVDCKEEVHLEKLLADIVSELSGIAAEYQVTLSMRTAPCIVHGNRNLLYRAFYNLVENAIKYNRPGGLADITVREVHCVVTVSVSDTGIGMSPEQQALIFEPFYRVDKSRSRKMGGAGLGLSTVKAIVNQHGGSITVEEKQGGGSVFTVSLPQQNRI